MNLVKQLNLFSTLISSRSASLKMKIDKMADVISCSQEKSSEKAAECLVKGQVVAVPTDTIYGLACSANCPEAIKNSIA